MENMFNVYTCYSEEPIKVSISVADYADNGNMAIWLYEDGEPFEVITVNLGEELPFGHAYINTNCGLGLGELLTDSGLAKYTGIVKPSGFCCYPLYEFSLELLTKICPYDMGKYGYS